MKKEKRLENEMSSTVESKAGGASTCRQRKAIGVGARGWGGVGDGEGEVLHARQWARVPVPLDSLARSDECWRRRS